MAIQKNDAGLRHAKHLIEQDQYVKESEWSEVQPTAADENDFAERNGWDEYAKWFLAIDTDHSEDSKARYKFPHGDFRRVHRSGVIAAKQRAGQQHYEAVEQAADDLLRRLPKPDEA